MATAPKKTTTRRTTKKPVYVPSLPYEEWLAEVRAANIKSKSEYTRHHEEYKPSGWPAYPNRAYQKVWVGWVDALQTTNQFGFTQDKAENFQPYAQAVLQVHKMKLPTMSAWMDYVKECGDNWDETIPKRPDLFYKKDWVSWGDWLGNSVDTRLAAHQRVIEKNLSVFYVYHPTHYTFPGNLFRFEIDPAGIQSVRSKINEHQHQLVTAYWYDQSKSELIQQIINGMTSEWNMGSSKDRLTYNIHDVCWELDYVLERVRI